MADTATWQACWSSCLPRSARWEQRRRSLRTPNALRAGRRSALPWRRACCARGPRSPRAACATGRRKPCPASLSNGASSARREGRAPARPQIPRRRGRRYASSRTSTRRATTAARSCVSRRTPNTRCASWRTETSARRPRSARGRAKCQWRAPCGSTRRRRSP